MTRALVRDLIAREFGIEVGEDTVRRYLRAWGVQSAEADASCL